MKIIYLVNARLPTEKAHGYQICKMCEAFAVAGADVHLLHPRRIQTASISGRTVFDYYGLKHIFRVQTLANWDVLRLERLVPRLGFTVLFILHAVLWGLFVARTARKQGADLFFTRDIYCAFWLVKMGLPTVYEMHVDAGSLHRFLLRRIVRVSSLKQVIALAGMLKDYCIDELECPPEKVSVVHHGVDIDQFEYAPDVAACRNDLGLPSDRRILGYVGRFEVLGQDKGVADILQAMALVCKTDMPKLLLLCVGGPMNNVERYLQFADSEGIPRDCLRFVDRVPNDDVPRWLRSCDAVVLPLKAGYMRHIGAMPLKLFEYMAAGAPIVASDLPVIREVLTHEKNAWLVQAGSDRALADGIKAMLTNEGLARHLARQARDDVQQNAWRERASKIMRLGM